MELAPWRKLDCGDREEERVVEVGGEICGVHKWP